MNEDFEFSPESDLRNKVESHVTMSDLLLLALLDVADAGRQEMEEGVYDHGERFMIIRELLEQYRERNSTFIKSLYPKKAA